MSCERLVRHWRQESQRRASGIYSLGGAGLVTEAPEIPSVEYGSEQAARRFTVRFWEHGTCPKKPALVRRRNGDDLLALNALVEPPPRPSADPGQGRHKRELPPASVAGRIVGLVVVSGFHRGSITEMTRARFPEKPGLATCLRSQAAPRICEPGHRLVCRCRVGMAGWSRHVSLKQTGQPSAAPPTQPGGAVLRLAMKEAARCGGLFPSFDHCSDLVRATRGPRIRRA